MAQKEPCQDKGADQRGTDRESIKEKYKGLLLYFMREIPSKDLYLLRWAFEVEHGHAMETVPEFLVWLDQRDMLSWDNTGVLYNVADVLQREDLDLCVVEYERMRDGPRRRAQGTRSEELTSSTAPAGESRHLRSSTMPSLVWAKFFKKEGSSVAKEARGMTTREVSRQASQPPAAMASSSWTAGAGGAGEAQWGSPAALGPAQHSNEPAAKNLSSTSFPGIAGPDARRQSFVMAAGARSLSSSPNVAWQGLIITSPVGNAGHGITAFPFPREPDTARECTVAPACGAAEYPALASLRISCEDVYMASPSPSPPDPSDDDDDGSVVAVSDADPHSGDERHNNAIFHLEDGPEAMDISSPQPFL